MRSRWLHALPSVARPENAGDPITAVAADVRLAELLPEGHGQRHRPVDVSGGSEREELVKYTH